MRKTGALIGLTLTIGTACSTGASPWTLPQKGVYVRSSFIGTRSQASFDGASRRVRFPNNGISRIFGASLDAAYGLRDNLMASVSVPVLFYRIQNKNTLQRGTSLGDVRLSARYRVLTSPVTTSVGAAVKFPTAAAADPSRIRMGEGQYDFDFVAAVGRPWPSLPVYTSLDVGYRLRRTNSRTRVKPGDEIIYQFESGYRVSDRLFLSAAVGGFISQAGRLSASVGPLFLRHDFVYVDLSGSPVPPAPPGRHLLSISGGVVYNLTERIGLALNTYIPVAGRNSYAGSYTTVGLFYNRSGTRISPVDGSVVPPSGGAQAPASASTPASTPAPASPPVPASPLPSDGGCCGI